MNGRHRMPLDPFRIVALLATLGAPALAGAATLGNLVQLPGTDACVSETGSSGNCADGVALDGAAAVAISRSGLRVFVAAPNADAVAAFLRVPSTGALLQPGGIDACVSETGSGGLCADGRALDEPRGVTTSPDARSLYVASTTSDGVAAFALDDKAGTLTQLAGIAGCVTETGTGGSCADGVALGGARALAVTPNGKSLYVASRDSDAVAAFARDKITGAITQLAGTDACVSETGTAGACANGVALDFPTGVAVSPNGKNVYVTAAGSNAVSVFSREVTTGALTQLAGTAGCVSEDGTGGACADGRALLAPFAVAVSQNGKSVYVASRDSGAIAVFARDAKTGALAQLTGTAGCISEDGSGGECVDGNGLLGAMSVAITRNGRSVYVAAEGSNAVTAFARDLKTGALAQLAGVDGCTSESGTGGTCSDGVALAEARAVAVTRNARNAYVASSTSDAVAAFRRE
jgi:6-phosphogluconolactonase (cycloisomerase 2 family)